MNGGIVMRKIERVKETAKNLLNVGLNLADMGYIDEALTIFDAVKCIADLGAYVDKDTYCYLVDVVCEDGKHLREDDRQ